MIFLTLMATLHQTDASAFGDDTTIWKNYHVPMAIVSTPLLYNAETEEELKQEGCPGCAKALVYVGSNDRQVYAMMQNNGTVVWKRELGSRVQPAPVMGRADAREGEGPRDVLLVAAERGDVIGFDPLTGERLWKSDLGGNCAAAPALTPDRTIAYFTSGNRVVLLSVTNGHILGTVGVEVASGATMHATPLLVPMFEGADEAAEASGGADSTDDTAVVLGWKLYVTTSVGGLSAFSVRASEPAELELVWRYDTKAFLDYQTSPVISDGRVFLGGYSKILHTLNASTGELLWQFHTNDVVPTVALTPDKTRVVFGGSDRWVYSLAVEDGMTMWKKEFGYSVQSPPTVRGDGSFVVTGTLPKEVKTDGQRGQTIRRGERVAAYSYTGAHLWGYGLDGTLHGSAALSDDGCSAYFGSNDGTVYRVGHCPAPLHDEL